MAFGNLDKSPGIHLYGVVQAALAGAPAVNELVSGQGGAWTDEAVAEGRTADRRLDQAGLPHPGHQRRVPRRRHRRIRQGRCAVHPHRHVDAADDAGRPRGRTSASRRSPRPTASPATTGGQGLAWAITSKSAHPDVAAAYVDFITNAKAAQMLLDTGNLPTVLPSGYQPRQGTVAADIATQYRDVQKAERRSAVPGLLHPHLLRHDHRGHAGTRWRPVRPATVRRQPAEGLRGLPDEQEVTVTLRSPRRRATRPVAGRGRRPVLRAAGAAPARRSMKAYLYVAPAFLVFAAFLGAPVLQTVQYSFYDWDGLGAPPSPGCRTTSRSSPTNGCGTRSCTPGC